MKKLALPLTLLVAAAAAWMALTPASQNLPEPTPGAQEPASPGLAESAPEEGPENPTVPQATSAQQSTQPITVEPAGRPSRGQPAKVVPPENPALKTPDIGPIMNFDRYADVIADADSVSGQDAFVAYEYVRSCIGAPVTEQDYETRLEQYTTAFERRGRSLGRRYDRVMERTEQLYLRCEGLGEGDLIQLAAEWLQLAADLDYLPAQVRFYLLLPQLLNEERSRVFKEPVYLEIHREKSADYLERAIRTGHPEAFTAMAGALQDGVIYQQDSMAAVAYMGAAALARGEDVDEAVRESGVALDLTVADRALARSWARTLCRQYCQWQDEAEPIPPSG